MRNTAKPNFQNPDENPGYQLWLVSNLWQRRVRKVLEPFGLTHVQFLILAVTLYLCKNGEAVTQAKVARHADIDEMMTSQVVRSLEERKLISREAHPKDARARVLAVTPEGKALATQARTAVRCSTADLFAPLGEKQFELTRLMRELVHHWRDCPQQK